MAAVFKNVGNDGKVRSYTVRWRDPGGRQRERTFKVRPGADAYKEATAYSNKVENDKLQGTYVAPKLGRTLFGERAEAWLTTKRTHRRGGTADNYETNLRKHILPTFENQPLAGIRRSDIQAWVNACAKTDDNPDGLAPATLKKVYSFVASIFREAVRDGYLAKSPCDRIELPDVEDEEATPLTPEQLAALVAAITPRYRALVFAAAGTGLRQGELFGLTVDRVDFLRFKIKVDRQLIGVQDAGPIFGPPKTASSKRTVPLAKAVADALSVHLATYGEGPERLIFTNNDGRPIIRRHFYDSWKRALKAAGLPEDTRFHVLRHTFVSLLIKANESPKAIQRWVGHKSIIETMDTYGHLYEESEDTARAAIDAALNVAPSGSPATAAAENVSKKSAAHADIGPY
jgi:integrase